MSEAELREEIRRNVEQAQLRNQDPGVNPPPFFVNLDADPIRPEPILSEAEVEEIIFEDEEEEVQEVEFQVQAQAAYEPSNGPP